VEKLAQDSQVAVESALFFGRPFFGRPPERERYDHGNHSPDAARGAQPALLSRGRNRQPQAPGGLSLEHVGFFTPLPAAASRSSSSICRASTIGSTRARNLRTGCALWWLPTENRRRPEVRRVRPAGRGVDGTGVAWVRPNGVKGWVHVQSHTDPPRRLLEYREWVLRLASGERLTRRVTEGRAHADGLVAHLEGVADRDQALPHSRAPWWKWIARRCRRRVIANYYRADLAGFSVRTSRVAELGTVSHFVDMPAGPVMVTVLAPGGGASIGCWRCPRHLRKVDLAARTILVDWPAELE